MNEQIIGLQDWFQTPPGRYLLAWEQAQLDRVVVDVFGYHALQLGLPELQGLAANRMPHRWLASAGPLAQGPSNITLMTDFSALPFAQNSLDLVVLPHSLEFAPDPHRTLREVERVLVPEGRVVICGLNPMSLWGMRQLRGHLYRRVGVGDMFLPPMGEFIGYWRIRDWLQLLGFDLDSSQFGCYRPSFSSDKWLQRFDWMDDMGSRWWPILGAVYVVVAVKRVRGMTLLTPAWKPSKGLATAPVSVASSQGMTRPRGQK